VRIVGELRKLGIDVSATLVRNLLRNAGIPPAPLACDFLTVDTVLLRRLYVLVFICIGSRRIELRGLHEQPRQRLDDAAGA
jgi:putative transposase